MEHPLSNLEKINMSYGINHRSGFHVEFDAPWSHQDGLDRRQQHPSGLQQEKLMALFIMALCMCDTSYNPILL